MSPQILFEVMEKAPPAKLVRSFRRDAGWAENPPDSGSSSPKGRVVWMCMLADRQKIGIVRLELAPPEFCYVADLIILRQHRSRGLGRRFMAHIESFCAGLGIKRLLLEPKQDAAAFYAALNFVQDPFVPGFLKKDINPFQKKAFTPGR